MARTKTSKAWMHEHVTDPFVRRAKQEGYRSRAAYKLVEILEKDKLVRSGMTVVDLGAAPGGWSQVLAPRVGAAGRLIALDLLDMEPIRNVEFVKADFTTDEGLAALRRALDGRLADLVVSDMAPNISGVAMVDQARSIGLAELALEFTGHCLKPGGSLLVKVFQGAGLDAFRRQLEAAFQAVAVRKPKASRDRSSELFLLAKGRRAAP
jgi:23S rRNA (uridine2552-2'-O)-methyltransferase